MTTRVAIVNPVWNPEARSPEQTLDRFATLTGWAGGVAAAGADVTVHQRFPSAASLRVGGVPFHFVPDRGRARPGWGWRSAGEIAASVRAADPHVVHVNGVVYPEWVRALRRHVPARVRLVAQDHGGWHPAQASAWSRAWVRRGLSAVDAVLVSSPGHVAAWQAAGVVPGHVRAVDVMESSVTWAPMPRGTARAKTGVTGDPAILWVGRLTMNKDPLTVLDGFARFLSVEPDATLTWVFSEGVMEAALRRAMAGDLRVSAQVRLVGAVSPADMPAYYSAADIFVSGSRMEGSGYAAIEAMACGATPVLTDIPSFRTMTDHGRVGGLWSQGHAQSLCDALTRVAAEPRERGRERVRARFDEALSWEVIGRRAVEIYREVCAR